MRKKEGKIIYKLFSMLLVSICIPLLIFSYVSYVMSYQSIGADYKEDKNNLDRQVSENIENNFYTLQNQSIALYDYDSISYILDTDKSEITDEYVENYNLVYGNLVSIIQGNLKLDSISLINLDGEVKFYFDRNMSSQNLNTVADEPWFSRTIEANGRAVIVPPHENIYTNKKEKVVSVCRVILNPYDDTVSGVLKIDQEVSTFESIFDMIDKDEGEIYLVFSSEGEMFYESGGLEAKEAQSLFQYVEAHEGGEMTWDHEGAEIVTYGTSSKDNWKVISLVPEKNIHERAAFIRRINTGLTAVLVIICAGVSVMISMTINKPIRSLKTSMKEFRGGNLAARVEINRNDEFGMIANVFNSMVENIRKLINEQYELKLLKKQAQLENYQSQINPHYLFNTLNSIKAVSMQEGAQKTTQMIQCFSDGFRYALNRGVYVVSFREELEYIDKYILLQMMRFGEKVQVEKEIEDEVLDNECLRMVLQPIIENAFYHGLEKTAGHGRILIMAQNVGDEFLVYISNTGTVVPPERMKEINEQLSGDEERYRIENSDKVGIFNVNARIKYHYGSQYGLRMIYGTEKETTIKIYLPCRKLNQRGPEEDENTDHRR